MKPLLLLVDLQQDFLSEPGLEPHRDSVVAGAAHLLALARAAALPVLHLLTTVRPAPDRRMRHWRLSERWSCLEGTPGHAPPAPLAPLPGEGLLEKSGFGAGAAALAEAVRALRAEGPVVIAGVHTHACVRQAALDLNEAGLEAWIAREAVGSTEPWHAAQAELYLRRRLIPFVATGEIAACFGGAPRVLPLDPSPTLERHVRAARPTGHREQRLAALETAATVLEAQAEILAGTLVEEVGKPLRYARGEAARCAALLRAVVRRAGGQDLDRPQDEALVRRRPLGRVAVITPWNNPIAIAAGQLAPALAYGNAAIWKPSPAGQRSAALLHRLLLAGGIEEAALQLLQGDAETALALAAHPAIDGVCFTGATATGRLLGVVCAARNRPLQAELGGNNAAILLPDSERPRAARLIAEAAFGCAGQRCTATRRVIVPRDGLEDSIALLAGATATLAWGDPRAPATQVGPLLNADQAARVAACVERARAAGHRVLQPHLEQAGNRPAGAAFYPPTLVLCEEPLAEIVQEETFGPVLVIQPAKDWDEALALQNGVRQGLAAALFGGDEAQRRAFLATARAGIIKLDQATVEAGVDVPFGGWKVSGLGPPQHGDGNLEFFTRAQALYGALGGLA